MTEERQIIDELHNIWFDAKGVCTLAIGYMDAFLEGTLADVTDEQREALKVIRRNTCRLFECTQHAAEFARFLLPSTGKEPLQLKPVSLVEVVELAVHGISVYSRTRAVEVHIPVNLPSVQADFHWLCRGIENILDPFPYDGGHEFNVSAHPASEEFVLIEIGTNHQYLPGGRLSVAAHIIDRHGSELQCDYSDKAAKFQFALHSVMERPTQAH